MPWSLAGLPKHTDKLQTLKLERVERRTPILVTVMLSSAQWLPRNIAGRGAQHAFFETGEFFARIDRKLQATHPVCCILSSLGPDSLCMYTIVILCGGRNSPTGYVSDGCVMFESGE